MPDETIVLYCEYCEKDVTVIPQASVIAHTEGDTIPWFLVSVDLSCPECDHPILEQVQGWLA